MTIAFLCNLMTQTLFNTFFSAKQHKNGNNIHHQTESRTVKSLRWSFITTGMRLPIFIVFLWVK